MFGFTMGNSGASPDPGNVNCRCPDRPRDDNVGLPTVRLFRQTPSPLVSQPPPSQTGRPLAHRARKRNDKHPDYPDHRPAPRTPPVRLPCTCPASSAVVSPAWGFFLGPFFLGADFAPLRAFYVFPRPPTERSSAPQAAPAYAESSDTPRPLPAPPLPLARATPRNATAETPFFFVFRDFLVPATSGMLLVVSGMLPVVSGMLPVVSGMLGGNNGIPSSGNIKFNLCLISLLFSIMVGNTPTTGRPATRSTTSKQKRGRTSSDDEDGNGSSGGGGNDGDGESNVGGGGSAKGSKKARPNEPPKSRKAKAKAKAKAKPKYVPV
ncbi:hypothetical protein BDN72DRAFT_915410, partial [Pluteus cervinus]